MENENHKVNIEKQIKLIFFISFLQLAAAQRKHAAAAAPAGNLYFLARSASCLASCSAPAPLLPACLPPSPTEKMRPSIAQAFLTFFLTCLNYCHNFVLIIQKN